MIRQRLPLFFQHLLHILRKPADKQLHKCVHLISRDLKDHPNALAKSGQDRLKGFAECDIRQLITEKEKQLAERPLVLIFPLFQCHHQVAGKYDRNVGCQSIVSSILSKYFLIYPELFTD